MADFSNKSRTRALDNDMKACRDQNTQAIDSLIFAISSLLTEKPKQKPKQGRVRAG